MFVIFIVEYDARDGQVIAAGMLLVRLLRRSVVLSPIFQLEVAAGLSGTSTKELYLRIRQEPCESCLLQESLISRKHRRLNEKMAG